MGADTHEGRTHMGAGHTWGADTHGGGGTDRHVGMCLYKLIYRLKIFFIWKTIVAGKEI